VPLEDWIEFRESSYVYSILRIFSGSNSPLVVLFDPLTYL
jgi:hypothetical protein